MIAALVLAQCFLVEDASPGWKQIALPELAPQLAAAEAFEQYRSQEPVLVTWDQADVLRVAGPAGLGKVVVEVSVPRAARAIIVSFARPLDGAKVDAVLEGPRGRIALLDEKRVAGRELSLRPSLPDANRLTVTVHHHLRSAPVLERVAVEQLIVPTRSPELEAAMKAPGSLYVRSPGGPLTLCQRPGQLLVVSKRVLDEGAPVLARLRPTASNQPSKPGGLEL